MPYIAGLVARKTEGPEKSKLDDPEAAFHQSDYARPVAQLEAEAGRSHLPE